MSWGFLFDGTFLWHPHTYAIEVEAHFAIHVVRESSDFHRDGRGREAFASQRFLGIHSFPGQQEEESDAETVIFGCRCAPTITDQWFSRHLRTVARIAVGIAQAFFLPGGCSSAFHGIASATRTRNAHTDVDTICGLSPHAGSRELS